MTRRKNNKRALTLSLLSLLLCMAMLVGSTFAWFTDNASTKVNTIQAGTLDVGLEMLVNDEWVNAEGETLNFIDKDENKYWEPGCTYDLTQIRVVNNGNLAVKFKIIVDGIDGDAKLNEAIEWQFSYGAGEGVSQYDWNSEDGIIFGLSAGGNMPITISGHMKEEAGNEYQGLSIEGAKITVLATQLPEEYDSYNNTYDAGAEFAAMTGNWDTSEPEVWGGTVGTLSDDLVIDDAAEFAAFAAAVNAGDDFAGKTVKLNANIDLTNLAWTSISNFAGTFDGQWHVISNLKDATLFGTVNGTVKNLKLEDVSATTAIKGFLGEVLNGTVENVAVEDAAVTLNGYLGDFGGLVGKANGGAVIDGCSVNGLSIVITGDDNGDDVGGLVGYVNGTAENKVKISNSTVTNVTIDASYKTKHFGGFVGETYYVTFENCAVENLNFTVDEFFYHIGGFVANAAQGSEFVNCDVNGATFDVTNTSGTSRMGGFAGRTRNVSGSTVAVSFKDCDVTGLKITVHGTIKSHVSGFSGNTTGEGPTTMENCSVAGEIDITDATIGSSGTVNKVTKQDHADDSINCTENVTITQN